MVTRLVAITSLVVGYASAYLYTMDFIKQFGPDCFDAINNNLRPDEVFFAGRKEIDGVADSVTIGINPGYFCYFSTYENTRIEGDEHL